MAKIAEVATKAGVSIKTVSRVMNREAHVRPELRERVLAAARELNYRPKLAARTLASGRSFVICHLLSAASVGPGGEFPISYAQQVQVGSLRACRAAGRHLMIEAVDLEADVGLEIERLNAALPVAGVVLAPPLCDDAALLAALEANRLAYVRISPARDPERAPCIEIEDEAGAYAMTEHLIGLGHRRIGFVMGPPEHGASALRLRGYERALKDHGLSSPESLRAPGAFTFQSGLEAAGRLLGAAEPPTAIFAANDASAAGVMAKARELGRDPPNDLSIAGFDDDPVSAGLWPPLTTMRQPIAEMAAAAAELLIEVSSAAGRPRPYPRQRFGCELVVRASTAPPPS